MKQNIKYLIILWFYLFLFSFNTISADESSVLLIKGDYNYPPYEYLNEKNLPDGFNVDIMRAVAEEMGMEIQIELDFWQTVRFELEEGKIDVLMGMFRTEERDKLVDFSIPHFIASYAVFVTKGSIIKSLEDARNKTIIVQKDDLGYDYIIENNITDKIISKETTEEVLFGLFSGLADCAVVSRLQGMIILKNKGIKNILAVGPPIIQRKYCFAVTEGNGSLLAKLNEGLSIIKTSGEYDRIYDKWFGIYEGIGWNYQKLLKYLFLIISPLFLIIIFAFLWTWSLKKQVTSRTKDLRKRETHLRTLLETIPDLIWLKDPNGIYLSCNRKFGRYFGAAESEIYGKTDYDFVDRKQADLFREDDQSILATNSLRVYEEEMTFADDGHKEIVELIKTTMFESDGGKLVGVLGIARDITNRKKAEEELRHYREHLEDLVRDRTIELEKEKERAEIADKAKSEFLANMSHELRTPLNAVIGFSELLSSIMSDEKQKNYVKSIKLAGSSLLTLINDILDLSKIEVGMLEIKPTVVNIRSVIGEIVQIFAAKTEKKGIEFLIEIKKNVPDNLLLDEFRIRQILLNLIGNAEKFTEKGYIKISVDNIPAEKDHCGLILLIEDSGIGIDPQNIDKIFEAFKQHDGLDSKKYGGTGLGLAICKKMISAMGGEIAVTSNPGEGSVFEIIIKDILIAPGEITETTSDDNLNLDNTTFEDATILVVDDIETSRKIMKEMLPKIGFKVITAENGKVALDLISNNKPDLIFMDIRMPVLDGVSATIKIKANHETQNIPDIAMTASSSAENRESLLKKGFDQYLSKPFKVSELISILSGFFSYTSLKKKDMDLISLDQVDFNKVIEPAELLDLLYREILPTCQSLRDVMIMSRITAFGKRIEEIAEKHKISLLLRFGSDIITYADSFDTVAIVGILGRLADGIEQLNIMWEKFNGKK